MQIVKNVDKVYEVVYTSDSGNVTLLIRPLGKAEYNEILESCTKNVFEFDEKSHKKRTRKELDEDLFDLTIFNRVCAGWKTGDLYDEDGNEVADTPENRAHIVNYVPAIKIHAVSAALNTHLHIEDKKRKQQEAEIKN